MPTARQPRTPKRFEPAVTHLRSQDAVIRQLIDRVGPVRLRQNPDRFWMLVSSIVSQQLSMGAARTILGRLEALLPDRSAAALARISPTELRSAGISPQKSGYLEDLCRAVSDGRIDLRSIGRLRDERVIESLVQVRGIGRWTAQMFLIFSLGRLDVFPAGDLGVRSAIRGLYGLSELPTESAAEQIAENWRPYATIGSWYCWRYLELPKVQS